MISFDVGMGGEVIRDVLAQMDINALADRIPHGDA